MSLSFLRPFELSIRATTSSKDKWSLDWWSEPRRQARREQLIALCTPDIAIVEEDGKGVVTISMQGLIREKVKVILDDATLSITGSFFERKQELNGNWEVTRTLISQFERTIKVSPELKNDNVRASLLDDQLSIEYDLLGEGSEAKQVLVQ